MRASASSRNDGLRKTNSLQRERVAECGGGRRCRILFVFAASALAASIEQL
jgi:hypothetical protein